MLYSFCASRDLPGEGRADTVLLNYSYSYAPDHPSWKRSYLEAHCGHISVSWADYFFMSREGKVEGISGVGKEGGGGGVVA